jgi:hypothetical protein
MEEDEIVLLLRVGQSLPPLLPIAQRRRRAEGVIL